MSRGEVLIVLALSLKPSEKDLKKRRYTSSVITKNSVQVVVDMTVYA